MHPGWADTEGVRTSIPGFHSAFQAKLRDTAQGADTMLLLGLADAAVIQPGAFDNVHLLTLLPSPFPCLAPTYTTHSLRVYNMHPGWACLHCTAPTPVC